MPKPSSSHKSGAPKGASSKPGIAKALPKSRSQTASGSKDRRRFWLNYPSRQITRPIVWELSQKFDVIFNIRQASISDEIGILCLELEGDRAEVKAVIAWLEAEGVKVEPVEIGVIES